MQRHQARLGGLLLSVVTLLGATYACQLLSEDPEEKAVKGMLVNPHDPIASHTVSIMDPDPTIGQYCSAVVLSRDIIMTAAHCFNDKARRPYVLFSTAYNSNLSNKQQPLIKVRRIAVHAQYSQEKGDIYDKKIFNAERPDQLTSPGKPLYDIALAFLAARIPDSYEGVPLAGSSIDFANGLITSAGYGCTTTMCRGKTNILRKVPMRYVRTFNDSGMVVILATNKHGSCSGDSGGPDFIDQGGVLRVFALISTGPDSCEAGLSVDTLLEPYKGWIEQASNGVRSGRKGSSYTLSEF